ncbi:hypothetical protein [Rheinheimera sp. 1928-s]|uniref:hypothetical protein n=1 Tax=Rheinheimera sp. 1928-s TaxID=3033803 RepID=UPI002627ACA3|nr:hypothetical protein [Rheinheimera sp. 1928-s]MDF3124670.1 hypothetical protein [Rheinheimera sp. 1928-s]
MTTDDCVAALSTLFNCSVYQDSNGWSIHIDSQPARTIIFSDSFVRMTLEQMQPHEFVWIIQRLPDTQWQRLPDGNYMTILS